MVNQERGWHEKIRCHPLVQIRMTGGGSSACPWRPDRQFFGCLLSQVTQQARLRQPKFGELGLRSRLLVVLLAAQIGI